MFSKFFIAISLVTLASAGLITVDLTRSHIQKQPQNFLSSAFRQSIGETPEEPLQNFEDIRYSGIMSFGTPGQNFLTMFDTGSSNLWVYAESCQDKACQNHPKFDPSKSSTFQANQEKLTINYGAGRVDGVISTDSVTLAGVEVQNQQFGLIQNSTTSATSFDAIMGLAYKKIASDNVTPVFQNMVQQGLISGNSFSMHLNNKAGETSGSKLILGGIDSQYYGSDDKFTYTPVILEEWWTIAYSEVGFVGGSSVKNSQMYRSISIVDSGTPVIALDANLYQELFANQKITVNQNCQGIEQLPNFYITIEDKQFEVSYESYVIQLQGQCQFGIVPGQKGMTILGDVFMRQWYTHFDFENNQVGFAKDVQFQSSQLERENKFLKE